MMEFAFALPVLVLILFAIVDFSRFYSVFPPRKTRRLSRRRAGRGGRRSDEQAE
jgi:TadE-like protein